jgi:hypothetical protein
LQPLQIWVKNRKSDWLGVKRPMRRESQLPGGRRNQKSVEEKVSCKVENRNLAQELSVTKQKQIKATNTASSLGQL